PPCLDLVLAHYPLATLLRLALEPARELFLHVLLGPRRRFVGPLKQRSPRLGQFPLRATGLPPVQGRPRSRLGLVAMGGARAREPARHVGVAAGEARARRRDQRLDSLFLQ